MNKPFLLAICCILLGNTLVAQSSPQVIDRIIAKVDNYITLQSELDLAYLDVQSRAQMGQTPDKCEVLRSLLQNKLMLAKAEIDSITVSPEEVNRELDRRLQYMVQQLGSEEEIERYYNKPLSQFKAELRDKMREQLVIERVKDNISADVKITPAEVKRFFQQIPADSLPFFSTEVTVGHIVKLPIVNREQKETVKARLSEIRQRILDKETTFAEMAKKYSEDPGSAARGGELGFWKRGELAPEYEAASLRMEPGQISKPVETQFGYHIIQLIERRGNSFNTRHILIKPQSSAEDIQEASRYLDSLRTEIDGGKIAFSKAAKEYSDDNTTNSSGGFMTDPSGAMRISVEDLDPSLYFVIDTMQVNTVTAPMSYRMPDGKQAMRIVYYKDKVGPHLANLRDDYQKIQQAALNDKKNRVIANWFEDAVQDVYISIDKAYDYCELIE